MLNLVKKFFTKTAQLTSEIFQKAEIIEEHESEESSIGTVLLQPISPEPHSLETTTSTDRTPKIKKLKAEIFS